MKRMLAAMLTALLIITFLPFAAPPAQAYIGFELDATLTQYANVGETFYWYVYNVTGGTPPYTYLYDVYRNGELYSTENYRSDYRKYFTPALPGNYYVQVFVADKNNQMFFKNSAEITVSAGPIKITKVEPAGATSLKITWNKMSGVIMYDLFRSTNLQTGWTWIKTTSGTSFTDTNLKAGTRYFYKVAYDRSGIIHSWESSAAAGVPMAKTRITSITSPTKGRVRLAWAKAAGASGYQVAMATSANGAYRPVRQLTGATVTFTGLKSGSALYFKIRPYRRIYSATYWGQYSGYRSVRVK